MTLVADIGQTVVHERFQPYENPIGATLLIKGLPVKVIGVYRAKGPSPMGQDQDDLIVIPFTTAERRVLGVVASAPSPAHNVGTTYLLRPNPFFSVPSHLTGSVNAIFV
ncbi:MAG: ABC transporter permease [Steroidobacteraceae bacterium]